jgi:hypothetical protein
MLAGRVKGQDGAAEDGLGVHLRIIQCYNGYNGYNDYNELFLIVPIVGIVMWTL